MPREATIIVLFLVLVVGCQGTNNLAKNDDALSSAENDSSDEEKEPNLNDEALYDSADQESEPNLTDDTVSQPDSDCPQGPIMIDCGVGVYQSICNSDTSYTYCEFVSEECLQGSDDAYGSCEGQTMCTECARYGRTETICLPKDAFLQNKEKYSPLTGSWTEIERTECGTDLANTPSMEEMITLLFGDYHRGTQQVTASSEIKSDFFNHTFCAGFDEGSLYDWLPSFHFDESDRLVMENLKDADPSFGDFCLFVFARTSP